MEWIADLELCVPGVGLAGPNGDEELCCRAQQGCCCCLQLHKGHL